MDVVNCTFYNEPHRLTQVDGYTETQAEWSLQGEARMILHFTVVVVVAAAAPASAVVVVAFVVGFGSGDGGYGSVDLAIGVSRGCETNANQQ